MKRIIVVSMLCLIMAGLAWSAPIKTLFGDINVPLPSETQIGLLANLIATPYRDIGLQQDAWAFTTEWVRQWDCLYVRSGYTSLNTWIPVMAGVDVLEAMRRVGWDIPTPQVLKMIGIDRISLNFLISINPQYPDKLVTGGWGPDTWKISK